MSILTTLFGLAVVTSVATGGHVAPDQWIPQAGDKVVVDTLANVGYLVRSEGSHTSFPILSGQRRVVRYIGRTYFAATPTGDWTIKEIEVKGRSMTFGETGTFLRFYDGDEKTAYGIHSHLTFKKMLAEGDPYRSMGCVLVDEDILQLIVRTFEANGGALDVHIAHGVDMPKEPVDTLAKSPSWLGM